MSEPCRIVSSDEGTNYCATCAAAVLSAVAFEREVIARMLEDRANEICHPDQRVFDTEKARMAIEIAELAERIRAGDDNA